MNNRGTILIADISGYSAFVKKYDSDFGASVVGQLLETLINASTLPFQISEIEGDAILFYQFGNPYSVDSILVQFERMLEWFNQKVEALRSDYSLVSDLSIKLIVHYGHFETFSVGGFNKLYGTAVVEAHRLLKNNTGLNTYALITEEYQRAVEDAHITSNQAYISNQLCEIYQDFGKICYSCYPFVEKSLLKIGGLFQNTGSDADTYT